MPTKRQFDMLIIVLLLWSPAKALAKVVAARHAANDTGLPQQVAKAGSLIL